jgi:TetR/AcrR family hemagglutinin/protease transcriptional regulator
VFSHRAKTKRRRAPRLAPQLRRRHLLDCAIRAFASKGVTTARHPDVAREAHVSLSTIFAYFPTRRALREAVFAELERWAHQLAEAAHRHGLAPLDALYEHLHRLSDLLQVNPDYARIWLGWSMAIEDELWPRYLELQRRIVSIVAATIRRGQEEGTIRADLDAEDGALALIGAAYMIAQTQAAGRRRSEVERFARLVESVFRPQAGGPEELRPTA